MEESVPVDFIEDDDFQPMDDGTDDSECDESEYGNWKGTWIWIKFKRLNNWFKKNKKNKYYKMSVVTKKSNVLLEELD